MLTITKLTIIFFILLVCGLLATKMSTIINKEWKFLKSKQEKTFFEKIYAWFGIISAMPVILMVIFILIVFFIYQMGIVH